LMCKFVLPIISDEEMKKVVKICDLHPKALNLDVHDIVNLIN
jgi:hypothetical protein